MLPDVGNAPWRPDRSGLMQYLVSELRRITLPRTPVNRDNKESRARQIRLSFSPCRILVWLTPLPYLGLERLAQRGVRLGWDDQVLILVDGELACAVVRDAAIGRVYEDPCKVHHDPVTGLPDPEVHAVFDLGRAVEVARGRQIVHEAEMPEEPHGRSFPVGREAPRARVRDPEEALEEQTFGRIPADALRVVRTRRVGPAAREQGVGLVGPRFVPEGVTDYVVAGVFALGARGRGRSERVGIDGRRCGRGRARRDRRQDQRQHAHHQGAAQSNVHTSCPFLYSLLAMSFGDMLHVGARKRIPTTRNPFLPLSLGGIAGSRLHHWLPWPLWVPVFRRVGF